MDRAGDDAASWRNKVDAESVGIAVQAGRITGGVHISVPRHPPGRPAQLPKGPPSFVGRSAELRWLDQVVADGHAPYVSGIGGTGKTGLLLHWAHSRRDRYEDGQLYVDLRGPDASAVRPAVGAVLRRFLEALGEPDESIPRDPEELGKHYRTVLGRRRVLVFADNAESPEQIRALLPGSSHATLIAAGRAHLDGLRISGFSLRRLDALSVVEAGALFERSLPEGDDRLVAEPAAVAEIARRCGQWPLPLLIAAGRAIDRPTLSLSALARELAARGLEAMKTKDGSESVREVLANSAAALTDEAREIFGLLAVSPGQDLHVTALAALADRPADDIVPLLDNLETMNLVQWVDEGRYRMHDLVRLYAWESAGGDDTALRRLVDHYLSTARAADLLLSPYKTASAADGPAAGIDASDVLPWFGAEHRNLLAVQQEALRRKWYERAWSLAWHLTDFQRWQGRLHDYYDTWTTALEAARGLGDRHRLAWAHRQMGQACSRLGRFDEAEDRLRAAIGLARSVDLSCEAAALRTLSRNSSRRGRHGQAVVHALEALDRYRRLGNPLRTALGLTTAAWAQAGVGNHAEARNFGVESMRVQRLHGNRYGVAEAAACLGYVDHMSGRHDRAVAHYQEAVAGFRFLQNTYKEADATASLGDAYAAVDVAAATTQWRRALSLYVAQNRTA
ncbi:tetratricopeptide repeat protein [Saccharothrix sp. 6-C]|uniref:tetratricopeptide repeat protein n=1 Tax=Saccharothrix sp. 6-C TaxID=2781735 RepID=UPI00191768AD|nr:tetratricopeptide repeat protein [Saccharothrix sp. 6-C]QQQ78197.1 tetratricopeptide repeat protein [Saccharothrix sp. 6-C]